jgi:hypothetical protein
MKTIDFLKLTGVVLMGFVLTAQVNATESKVRLAGKNTLTLTVDQPAIAFMAKAYSNDIMDATDVVRLQKVAGQIDQLRISFRDTETSDYVLKFSSLDEQGLESWMFNEGYLEDAPDAMSTPAVTTASQEPAGKKIFKPRKKSLDLTVETPIIEYLARIYADQVEAEDILRFQRMCRHIDHITVSFRDEDAADYVLRFKCLDEKALENWMFSEGYLVSAPEPEPEPVEPWMLDEHYLE